MEQTTASLSLDLDGISFHILFDQAATSNDIDRPYVLLSHALMADASMWDSTVVALCKARYNVIRYNHIGHGPKAKDLNSVPTGKKWHFDDFTRHIHLIVQHFQSISPSFDLRAVVGCSMGGVLALRYAMLYGKDQQHGRGPLKIITVGAPGMKALEESKPKWEERRELFRKQGVGSLAHVTAKRWFPDPVPPGLREIAEEMCGTCTLAGYEACAEAIVSYDYESNGELEELAARKSSRGEGEPTTRGLNILIIRGENDEAVGPKRILQDVARRSGGMFVEMKDVGHLPPMHDPEAFERILLDFLADS